MLRVVVIESLLDELRVRVVASEEDRLGQPVPPFDCVAMLHQVLEHLVHRVLVEEPAVDGGGVDLVRQTVLVHVVAPVEALPLFLFLVAERVVVDAFAGKLQVHLLHARWHEEAVCDGGLQFVGVGRHARLQVEECVGVSVYLLPWCRGQTDQQRVEVAEDRPVLLVHRAMRFVDDHEIEMPDAEARLATRRLVNQPHHRRIGADVDSTRRVLLGDEVHRAGLGEVCPERTNGLVHQRHPVGQEQRPLHPARPLQQVHQGDRRACLAAAGGHHQQRLASRLRELLADAANGPLLVVPLDDVVLHLRHIERGALGSANDQGRELVLLVEPGDRTWRVGEVIPQAGLVPVGVEDDRTLAMHRLQAVGVELRLLLAHRRVDGGLLRLHHR